jgi:hypothetical protein
VTKSRNVASEAVIFHHFQAALSRNAMCENVSPQLLRRLLLKVDGLNCAVRDGKKIVAMLEVLPGIRSVHLLFPSRSIVLESDGSPDSSSLESSALKCLQTAGYSATARLPQWSALSLVGVNCITIARRVEILFQNHPAVIKAHLDFAARRIFVLSDGDSAACVATAGEVGPSCWHNALASRTAFNCYD